MSTTGNKKGKYSILLKWEIQWNKETEESERKRVKRFVSLAMKKRTNPRSYSTESISTVMLVLSTGFVLI